MFVGGQGARTIVPEPILQLTGRSPDDLDLHVAESGGNRRLPHPRVRQIRENAKLSHGQIGSGERVPDRYHRVANAIAKEIGNRESEYPLTNSEWPEDSVTERYRGQADFCGSCEPVACRDATQGASSAASVEALLGRQLQDIDDVIRAANLARVRFGKGR